jgi:DNA-binding GntR family transcriptional regulator
MTGKKDFKTGDEETQDRHIASALIEDIVEWRIPPGSWIREREIAERFDVSHAPVREAFRHVANTGFVNVVPWRGAHVIEIDRHAFDEVFELWKALFGVVCRLAASKLTEDQGQELLRRLNAYDRLVRNTGNTFEHLTASNRIGAFIARASGAVLATELLNRIALFARWQHHVITKAEVTDEAGIVQAGIRSAELYFELVRALIRRDPEESDRRARSLLQHLQDRSVEPLEAYLARRDVGAKKARRPRS